MKHGKKYETSSKLIEAGKFYDVDEAMGLTVKTAAHSLRRRLPSRRPAGSRCGCTAERHR